MPVIKKHESLPKRQPVIVIYGEPGICKTSIVHTCEDPLLIDFDRGADRSFNKQDVLVIKNWDEVLVEEQAGTFKNYKTIGIDTAKAALDDYLMNYVISQDYKLKTNKLQMFGAIGDHFKIFINARRSEEAAIVIIAHSKKDEDTKKFIPDVTGQSYQLLLRIADQVGYVSMKNGKRTISFEPSDFTVGKNVACLPEIQIPDRASAEFKTFGKDLVDKVRESIASMSEEQREAIQKSEAYQQQIADAEIADLQDLLTVVDELPDYLRLPLQHLIGDRYAKALKATNTVECFNEIFDMINGLPDILKTGLRKMAAAESKERKYVANENTKKFEAVVNGGTGDGTTANADGAGANNSPATNSGAVTTPQQGQLIPEDTKNTGKTTQAKKEGKHATANV